MSIIELGKKRPCPEGLADSPASKRVRLVPPGSDVTKKDIELRLESIGVKPPGLRKDDLARFLRAVEDGIANGTYRPGQKQREYTLPPVAVFDNSKLPACHNDSEAEELWILGGQSGAVERLHKQGYLVVRVLNPATAERYRRRIMDWAMELGPDFDVEDSSTWTPTKMPPTRHGIYKVGAHSEVMWDLRVQPALLQLFQLLYGIENAQDLVASFDAFNISPPLSARATNSCWIHSDHPNPRFYPGTSSERASALSYQLCLSLSNAQAGTILMPDDGSSFDRLVRERPALNFTWGKVDPAWITNSQGQQLPATQFVLPPGYAVIWHSKVWHQGSIPVGAAEAARSPSDSLRVSAYLSYAPRSLLTSKELAQRVAWFKSDTNTGHWCFGPWLSPAAAPRHYGRVQVTPRAERSRLLPAEASDLQRRLVGYCQ